ncbi:hypothetical protein [Actinokineospora sp. UTMC 2448]|uniref:hypothetical protein n=1 Tax=Actinokineospora sp. UTMC 2448 TaxID=2268449 RepID=UPI002164008F|nr:hypothetical protein [Actinokineospora sp. UTMC 2448]UVS78332.1 hypothetical protein Actkin_02064 [Actinokineospora sp. UTMC 2448]
MLKRIGAYTVIAIAATAAPALAANPAGVADTGSAAFGNDDIQVSIAPIAPCSVDGQTTADAGMRAAYGVKFTSGTSSCTRTVLDADTSTTETLATAEGTGFELSALVPAGGPRIRIDKWRVACTGTQVGTNVTWSYEGMSGLSALPDPVPKNYVREIRKVDETLLATATFNAVTYSSPNDGSIAMSMLRIRFEPGSGMTGEVLLGNTACSPTP